jgi:hypothetical protein
VSKFQQDFWNQVNTRLQQLTNAHSSEISKLLKELCASNYLFPSGKGRGTIYHLNSKLDLKDYHTKANPIFTQPSLFDDSIPKEDTSILKMDTSIPKMDTSILKMDTSILDEGENAVGNKRLKLGDLNDLILQYCQTEYKSVEEIGKHLEKTSKYLKNSIIPRLIEQGLIERLYPGTPNHPQQKYKAKA